MINAHHIFQINCIYAVLSGGKSSVLCLHLNWLSFGMQAATLGSRSFWSVDFYWSFHPTEKNLRAVEIWFKLQRSFIFSLMREFFFLFFFIITRVYKSATQYLFMVLLEADEGFPHQVLNKKRKINKGNS